MSQSVKKDKEHPYAGYGGYYSTVQEASRSIREHSPRYSGSEGTNPPNEYVEYESGAEYELQKPQHRRETGAIQGKYLPKQKVEEILRREGYDIHTGAEYEMQTPRHRAEFQGKTFSYSKRPQPSRTQKLIEYAERIEAEAYKRVDNKPILGKEIARGFVSGAVWGATTPIVAVSALQEYYKKHGRLPTRDETAHVLKEQGKATIKYAKEHPVRFGSEMLFYAMLPIPKFKRIGKLKWVREGKGIKASKPIYTRSVGEWKAIARENIIREKIMKGVEESRKRGFDVWVEEKSIMEGKGKRFNVYMQKGRESFWISEEASFPRQKLLYKLKEKPAWEKFKTIIREKRRTVISLHPTPLFLPLAFAHPHVKPKPQPSITFLRSYHIPTQTQKTTTNQVSSPVNLPKPNVKQNVGIIEQPQTLPAIVTALALNTIPKPKTQGKPQRFKTRKGGATEPSLVWGEFSNSAKIKGIWYGWLLK